MCERARRPQRKSAGSMSSKIDDDENSALFYEVKVMMDEGDADEDRHSLSSDDEGYMDRLMEGRTVRLPSEENFAWVDKRLSEIVGVG